MNIVYLKNNEIDRNLWDKCVTNALNSKIYGLSWFLDLTCTDWDAIVINEYEAVLVLPVKIKFGLNYIPSVDYMQLNGIYSVKPLNEDLIFEVLEYIPQKFNAITLNINFNIQQNGQTFEILKRFNNFINLNNSYTNIYNNFSKIHKKNIKSAYSANTKFLTDNDIKSVVNMKKAVWERNNFPFIEKRLAELELIFINAREKTETFVYKVLDNNTVCAAAFFILFNKTFYIFSGTNEQGRKNNAMYLIMNEFLKQYSQKNYILDFGGSTIASISDWNKGFGAETEIYSSINKKSEMYKMLESLRMFVKR